MFCVVKVSEKKKKKKKHHHHPSSSLLFFFLLLRRIKACVSLLFLRVNVLCGKIIRKKKKKKKHHFTSSSLLFFFLLLRIIKVCVSLSSSFFLLPSPRYEYKEDLSLSLSLCAVSRLSKAAAFCLCREKGVLLVRARARE